MLIHGTLATLRRHARQPGESLVEVLISLLVVSFGLLSLVDLQGKMLQAQFESFQRAQAITLLADMTQRMQANFAHAASYVTAAPVGTSDALDCTTQETRAQTDQCEWRQALLGASETKASVSVGAMLGARGCVELVQPAASANCQPAIYRVTVVWQGVVATVAPSVTCGQNLYAAEAQRRAISAMVVAPSLSCS